MRLRTCTMLQYCGGTGERTYVVMRGPVRGRFFCANEANVVGTYTLKRGEKPDYRAMTARHATADAPAVYWQAEGTS